MKPLHYITIVVFALAGIALFFVGCTFTVQQSMTTQITDSIKVNVQKANYYTEAIIDLPMNCDLRQTYEDSAMFYKGKVFSYREMSNLAK